MIHGWIAARYTPNGWVCLMTRKYTTPRKTGRNRLTRMERGFILSGVFSTLPKPGFCKRPHKYLVHKGEVMDENNECDILFWEFLRADDEFCASRLYNDERKKYWDAGYAAAMVRGRTS